MPEPTSSGVAGAAAFKAAGGVAAGGALLSTIVVMLMTPPRTHREWAVGVISTVVTGIGGGAIAVQYFRLQEWVDSVTGLVALGGLIFGCGLPGGRSCAGSSTSSRRTGMPGSMRSRRK
jgi:hypothetical protein